MSIGFDRDRRRRQQELTNNKHIGGIYHVRILPKVVFGFAEHRVNATYALCYKLTSNRNKDHAVIDKAPGIADARLRIDHIHWSVLHYTPSFPQQGFLSRQILSKTPTELRFIERFFMKETDNQNLWNFELGSQQSMILPMFVIIEFQQRDRQVSQNLNNDTFSR